MKLSDLHFRVVDKGLFLPLARRLAREVGKVSYWTHSDKSFKTVRDQIGYGFDDIERVDCFLDDVDKVDCFVFPDIGMAGIQSQLEALGKPVWGASAGSELEEDRGKFLDVLKATGLPVSPYEKIKGLAALRRHLADKTDKWIKISHFRADWETLHWRSADEDHQTLDARAVRFGPFQDDLVFYVFDPIKSEIEDGCDTYCIDGAFPKLVVHGMEAKDKGYIGAFQERTDMPPQLGDVLEAFGPVLEKYGYRSCLSIEVRVAEDGTAYFIDPTCRCGSPPSQVLCELIDNWAEIIWAGAHGELVDPYPAARFGVQAIVNHKGSPREWLSLKVDDEIDRWLKCGNCMRKGDTLHFPPNPESTGVDIGWLTGMGDTVSEAIRHLGHNVALLSDSVSCEMASLADLLREADIAEQQDMAITDQPLPEPEIVVEAEQK